MRLRFLTCSAAAPLLLAAAAMAQQPPGGTIKTFVRPLVIRHVAVFDGTHLLHDQTVFAQGETIVEVGSHVSFPEGASVIEGRGKTLLPGLIDARTRTTDGDSLGQAVIFGVTTSLDMFTDLAALQKIRDEASFDRADLYSAGTIITVPGGYGTQFGIQIPTLAKEPDSDAFVAARVKEGSDYIYIAYDDGFASGNRWPEHNYATLHSLVEAAHKRKKLAIVHAGSLRESQEAIHAGADGLSHIFWGNSSDPAFATLAAKQKMFVIPLLAAVENACGLALGKELASDPKLEPYLSSADKTRLSLKPPHPAPCNGSLEAFSQLHKAHVTILAGSDSSEPGTAPGASLHRELEVLVRAGLSPTEALEAATSAAARAFHLDDRGVIAKGKRSDFFLVNGDPTKHILATRDIVSVWKQGVLAEREAYRSQLK
jgi:imidazolonepropionase-like amidohydrolase